LVLEQSVSLGAVVSALPEDSPISQRPLPLWTRMLIIVGGSALLWALIGTCVALAAQPKV
jgi:hypothetical protein